MQIIEAMKGSLTFIAIIAVLFAYGCSDDPEPETNSPYGLYDLTISYGTFEWGTGYEPEVRNAIGQIDQFQGFENNTENLENKIGILLDTMDNRIISATSCLNSLLFRYETYYHPTVSDNGVLEYPEFSCHPDFEITEFEGTFTDDSIYFKTVFANATRGTEYIVSGRKIDQ